MPARSRPRRRTALALAALAPLAAALTLPGVAAARAQSFRSPSGNIHCLLTDGRTPVAQCWVLSATCRSSRGTFAYSWAMSTRDRPVRFCPGDVVRGARVLPYGASARSGPHVCRSRMSGVTCRNLRTGHGFRLSRERQRTFSAPAASRRPVTPPSRRRTRGTPWRGRPG